MPSRRNSMCLAFQNKFFEVSLFLFLVFMSFFSPLPPAVLAAAGPPQPSSGVGGADYIHGKVISNSYGFGALKYYIFEPDSPKPETAPLVLFLHGWGVLSPNPYGAWIEHIVRKGNIVVYPIYQSSRYIPEEHTGIVTRSLQRAITMLKTRGHVEPDLNKFAIVGHSYGGILGVNISTLEAAGVPVPKAVMAVEPKCNMFTPLGDFSKIPADTLLLTVVGDQDLVAGDGYAREIFTQTSQIPLDRKDYIIMVSDYHGSPALEANHFTPASKTTGSDRLSTLPDALDYNCLWKLFEALTDAAFYERNWEYALGNTPQQRYMGEWSDGTPIKEMIVTDKP
ncbi:MAG: alpha/beta hydrolase [bacterium]